MGFPREFGPYHLIKQIAMGGMAEIVLAKTTGFGGFEKLLALKMIHPKLVEDRHFIDMLIEEAKICVELSHANICQVFDLGRIGDSHYLAMEYVEGVDVFKMMRRATEIGYEVPIEACVHIGHEICAGLDYAHTKLDADGKCLGIIHRDISPQNILISSAGEVKIIDFGIAKAGMRATQTEVGVIKGKYYYMSPEQAWADPVDHRTDIFSTGIVLYEMLTGQMLYLEENIERLLDRVRKAEIPPPSALRPDIPRELDAITMKALAKYPDDRYRSANEMGHALVNFLYLFRPDYSSAHLAAMMSWLFDDLDATDRPRAQDRATDLGSLLLTRENFIRRQPAAAGSLLYDISDLSDAADARTFENTLADIETTAPFDVGRFSDDGTTPLGVAVDIEQTSQIDAPRQVRRFLSADTQRGAPGWANDTGDETEVDIATDVKKLFSGLASPDAARSSARKADQETRILSTPALKGKARTGADETASYQPPPPPGFVPGNVRRPSPSYQPPSPTALGGEPSAIQPGPQRAAASQPPGGPLAGDERPSRPQASPLPQVTDPRGIHAPPPSASRGSWQPPPMRPVGRTDDTRQLTPDALRSVQQHIFGPDDDEDIDDGDVEPLFDGGSSPFASPLIDSRAGARSGPGAPLVAATPPSRPDTSAPPRSALAPPQTDDDSGSTSLTAYVPHPSQVIPTFQLEDDVPTSLVQSPVAWTRSVPESDLPRLQTDPDDSQPTVVIPERQEKVETHPTDVRDHRRQSVAPAAPAQPIQPAFPARSSQPDRQGQPTPQGVSQQPRPSSRPGQGQPAGPSPAPRSSQAPPWMVSGDEALGRGEGGAPSPPWAIDPDLLDERVLEAPPDLTGELFQDSGIWSVLRVLVPAAVIAVVVGGAYLLWPLVSRPGNTGRLDIRSHPAGARVTFDGQPVTGTTPLSIGDLEIGSMHQVELQLDGFVPWSQPVEIGHREVRQIAILRPILGTLRVTSDPPGASVSLDGVYQGSTPCEVEELDINRDLRVQVRYQGQSQTRDFSWQGRTEATLEFEFHEANPRRPTR